MVIPIVKNTFQDIGVAAFRYRLKEIAGQQLIASVTEVQGFGRQKGHTEIYCGAEYAERFLPKIKVEIACLSNQVDKVIETITSSANTGKIGDGKIFVYGLDHLVRIRTSENDADAI